MPPKKKKKAVRRAAPKTSPEEMSINRDFVMARLAAALSELDRAKSSVLATIDAFVNPDDDPKGEDRADHLSEALDRASGAVRALEMADEPLDIDPEEAEPWDDEEDDDEGEDPEDGDQDDDK